MIGAIATPVRGDTIRAYGDRAIPGVRQDAQPQNLTDSQGIDVVLGRQDGGDAHDSRYAQCGQGRPSQFGFRGRIGKDKPRNPGLGGVRRGNALVRHRLIRHGNLMMRPPSTRQSDIP